MSETPGSPPDGRAQYGTWIRVRRLRVFTIWAAGLTLLGLALAVALSPWFAALLVPAALMGYIAAILAATRRRLRPAGGDYQRRIHELIIDRVPVQPGHALDIGCGSGALAIGLARRHPGTVVTGVDHWGQDWEYSRAQCDRNARAEGVASQVEFRRVDAASLPFPDSSFDVVVSCLTFHEVRTAASAVEALREGLRVLAPGGRFVILDLFGDTAYYESPAALERAIQAAGCRVASLSPLGEIIALPFPLAQKKVLGAAMIVTGQRDPAAA